MSANTSKKSDMSLKPGLSSVFLRMGLAASFFSAVADRFGVWGAYGSAETILGMLLLIGWRLRVVSMMSGLLLLAFAVAMAFSLGVNAPLDYSVPSVAAAAILLASRDPDRFMLDAQLGPKRLSTLH